MAAFLALAASASADLLIAAADSSGGGSGVGELGILIAQLKNGVNFTFPGCEGGMRGQLSEHNVTLLYTGMGFMSAALCMQAYLLAEEAPSQIVFLGTSGWSPQIGGVFDVAQCASARAQSLPLPLGSVCVGWAATINDAKMSDYPSRCDTACVDLGDEGHSSNSTFLAQVDFWVDPAAGRLAAQIAKQSGPLPAPDQVVKDGQTRYWSAMSAGTGVLYSGGDGTPVVLTGDACAENAGYDFWVGLPYEAQCRLFTANVLGKAGIASDNSTVACVAAMEAPGWLRAVQLASTVRGTAIPTFVVRGNSDFVHGPLTRTTAGWHEMTPSEWYGENYGAFVEAGYRAAIASASAVVLRFVAKVSPAELAANAAALRTSGNSATGAARR